MSYQRVADAIKEFLEDSGATSVNQTVSGPEIVSHLLEQMQSGSLDVELAKNTLWQYLNKSAHHDSASPVRSAGTKQGYFVDLSPPQAIEPSEDQSTQITPVAGTKTTVYEKDLYPLTEAWLQTKGYAAKDVSTLKKGGPWGNPDVLGARRTELFGAVELEVASCEVKLDETNWQRFIFEAISHKRFSHRSWYCIRASTDDEPIPKGIEYYAERYKVGIVQIILSDDELAHLKSDPGDAMDLIDRVVERIPALFEPVPLREVAEALTRCGFEKGLQIG